MTLMGTPSNGLLGGGSTREEPVDTFKFELDCTATWPRFNGLGGTIEPAGRVSP